MCPSARHLPPQHPRRSARRRGWQGDQTLAGAQSSPAGSGGIRLQKSEKQRQRGGCAGAVPGERLAVDQMDLAVLPGRGAVQRLEGRQMPGRERIGLVGQQDHLRVGDRDRRQLDDRIARRRAGAQVVGAGARQHVVAVGVGVERHPGLAPDRAEDPWAPRQQRPQGSDGGVDAPRQRLRRGLGTDRRTEARDPLPRCRDAVREADEHGQAGGDQRLEVGPVVLLAVHDHQIGPQLRQAGAVGGLGAAHARQAGDHGRRLGAEAGDADQAVAGPEVAQQLGDARHQADDPPRRRRQRQRPAEIVGDRAPHGRRLTPIAAPRPPRSRPGSESDTARLRVGASP